MIFFARFAVCVDDRLAAAAVIVVVFENKDPGAALRGFPSVAARTRPGTRTNRIPRDCRRTRGTLHPHLLPYLKPYSYPF